VSAGKALCRFFLILSLAVSGCGYSTDHALDYHQQDKVTQSKQNVVKGSVYGQNGRVGSMNCNGQSIMVLTPGQRAIFDLLAYSNNIFEQPGFLDDDNRFYVHGAATEATLSANFTGETLYSFFQGVPIPRADVTLTQNWDWHGDNKLTLQIGSDSPLSTISINPFSNLAYWLGGGPSGNYSSYSRAREKIDKDLGFAPPLPTCWSEVNLCKDHLDFLQAGNTIRADKDGFTITRGGSSCSGLFSNYTANLKLCP